MNQILNNLLDNARRRLNTAGVETSGYELRLMLGEVLQCCPGELTFADISPDEGQLRAFEQMLCLRERHMPVDRILGRRGFYKYDFEISADVLSPRPDTEVLVENALEQIRHGGARTVLELGVGSGCVIVSLLAEQKNLAGVGVDISASALRMAAANAEALGVDSRLQLRQGNWFDTGFLDVSGSGYDIIVSNPPYIRTTEIAALDPEVRDYDPLLALDGGADGLESYRQIAFWAPRLLNPGGCILLEVGEGQAAEVAAIFAAAGLSLLRTAADLASVERCVILKK